jgi:hypothetical protein
MSPLEAAIRAVCRHIGADPETWRGFESIGLVALKALLEALPPDAAVLLREHLPT